MYLREALLERLAVRADLGRGSQVAEDLWRDDDAPRQDWASYYYA